MTPSHYQVLIPVSRGYPCVRGRLPTRYSPVRRYPLHQSTEVSINRFPLDLHVLGTPPAFILSQDQTLKKMLSQLFRVKIKFELLNSFWTSCVLFSLCEIIVFRNCTRMLSTRLQIVFFVLLLWILGDQLNDLFDSISTLCCFQGSRSVWRGTFKIIRIYPLLVNNFLKVFRSFLGASQHLGWRAGVIIRFWGVLSTAFLKFFQFI